MSAVGLNLSSCCISVIELLKSRNNLVIKNMVISEVPSNAVIKGEVQDVAALTTGLKDIWRKYKISDRKVFIGIANQKIIAKEVTVPVVDDTEINNSIKYQINDFIPIPKNNVIYDYYIVEKEKNSSKLMLVGTLKSMINDIAKSFKDAGLFSQAIDLNCFALYRTLDYIYGLEKNKKKKNLKSFCAVNLGEEISILEIIQDNDLRYPRFTSSSIKSFVDTLYKEIKKDNNYCRKIISQFDFKLILDEEKNKEKLKKETSGNTPEKTQRKESKEPGGKEDEKEDYKKKIVKIMKDTADHLVYEIKLSIESFLQENPKYKIEKIILSGKYIKNIDKYIEKVINYKVEILKIADYFSLKYIMKNPRYKGRKLNYLIDPLAVGMALRELNK